MERVCAIRVIAESELMQEFLTESEEEIGNSPLVDLKVSSFTNRTKGNGKNKCEIALGDAAQVDHNHG